MQKITLFCLCALLIACKNKQNTTAEAPTTPGSQTQTTELPTDFLQFYTRFHADSLYQMAHIVWPLQGTTSHQDDSLRTVRSPITYTQENWVLHRSLNSNDYIQEFTTLSPELIEETIRYASAGFGMKRRFAKLSDEWQLIYYSDMQEIK